MVKDIYERRGLTLSGMKRIYKLRQPRVVDGVCAGVAEYLGIDPLWVRIGWALLGVLGGIGFVAYLVGMYVFPRQASEDESHDRAHGQSRLAVGGVILLIVGVVVLLRLLGVVRYDFWGAWNVAWAILWPLSLIAGGAILVFSYWRQGQTESTMRRRQQDKMVLGVCSALGDFYNLDPNLVRFIFALAIILSRGIGLIVYAIMAILIPPEESDQAG